MFQAENFAEFYLNRISITNNMAEFICTDTYTSNTRYLSFSSFASLLAAAISAAVIEPWVRPSRLRRRSFFRFPSRADVGGVPPFRICRGEESRELVFRSGEEEDMKLSWLWRGGRESRSFRPLLPESEEGRKLVEVMYCCKLLAVYLTGFSAFRVDFNLVFICVLHSHCIFTISLVH